MAAATLPGPLDAVWAASGELTAAGFAQYKAEVRRKAARAGVSERILRAALDPAELQMKAVELDNRRPDTGGRQRPKMTALVAKTVSAERIRTGRERLASHRALLARVEAASGVAAEVIVALWGTETSYGRITGGFKVVDALATLAYEGRRRELFEANLIDALLILEEGHITPAKMTGSWAGAMGQCQFLPSSYRNFAVDFDGDGRTDIWETLADVFGSTANYLVKHGWEPGVRWGRKVTLPSGFARGLVDSSVTKAVDDWAGLGVRDAAGQPLPRSASITGSILQPDGAGEQAWLVYQNFRVLKRWNNSDYFGLSVGTLSDALA